MAKRTDGRRHSNGLILATSVGPAAGYSATRRPRGTNQNIAGIDQGQTASTFSGGREIHAGYDHASCPSG